MVEVACEECVMTWHFTSPSTAHMLCQGWYAPSSAMLLPDLANILHLLLLVGR